MNVLITGADGQLGCEFKHILKSGRAEIGLIPSAYIGAHVTATNKNMLDISNAAQVQTIMESERIDLILNCAAFTDVDACECEVTRAFAINAQAPGVLARAAEATGARLVHISTDYVFAGDDAIARIESDPTEPKSVYGASKLAGENAIRAACSSHFILRTAWLYGYRGPNFLETILRIAKEKSAITVVADQFGNPTNANDLAYEALKIALTDDFGIYHVTNNGICTWFDFASAIVDDAGIDCKKTPCSSVDFVRLAPRPAFSALDNARLRNTIGDQMRPWRDALKSYLTNRDERQSLFNDERL